MLSENKPHYNFSDEYFFCKIFLKWRDSKDLLNETLLTERAIEMLFDISDVIKLNLWQDVAEILFGVI